MVLRQIISELEKMLFENSVSSEMNTMIPLNKFIKKLEQIKETLITKHQSLFLDDVDDFINKVHLFGYHFASLDIRQDSRVHHNVFSEIVKTLLKNEYFNISE